MRSMYQCTNKFMYTTVSLYCATGNLPLEIGLLPNLKSLSIHSTAERGEGITGALLDFSHLRYLTHIDLGFNSLTGPIPNSFLAGISDPLRIITIDINSNFLTGTLPASLSHLQRVTINAVNNKIEAIDKKLCSMSEWMQGVVEEAGCDAILCPPGTFNIHGRQVTASDPCQSCVEFPLAYYGHQKCGSEQKTREKQILVKLYNECGGINWKRNDNWGRFDIDYCAWYGITCTRKDTIDSILLGSNNLVGTPPSDIFELKDLKWLWLYSNPINFKFRGIDKAEKLTSLLLDSTGLTSIDGISQAKTLHEIDLRFNSLMGTISPEIFHLDQLESLSLSNNNLLGTISGSYFGKLSNLRKLRLGSNTFTGTLPDFVDNPLLASLDVSNNKLTGTISPLFLNNAILSSYISLDLSSNQLEGPVPRELSRFDTLTLYLRGNKIDHIDPELCKKEEWNKGDVRRFGCNGIMCPKGTYSELGRQSHAGSTCDDCPENPFYGATTCSSISSANLIQLRLCVLFSVMSVVATLIVL
mmetsp:Transcript_27781/g.33794  ORF Transcript_27781/g.33794 Transcript_27781/m.33794 type:complete len:528 (-) Transcript_27781:147-1730(-)